MGLYDDLPEAKGGPASEASAAPVPSAWTAAALAPAVRRMAASASAKQQSRPLPTATAATTSAAAAAPAPAPPVPQQQRSNSNSYYAATFGPFDDDFDEYDPSYPNDFAALVARKESAAEEARLRAEAAAGVAAAAAAAAERERRIAAAAAEAAAAREREAAEKKKRKAEEEERERQREQEEEEEQPRFGLGSVRPFGVPSPAAAAAAAAAPPVPDSERGMPLAAKMMAKMGWEQGKGLGKQLQGAPLPLVAKKTSARAAVVVPAEGKGERGKEMEEKKEKAVGAPARPAVPAFSWPGEGDDTSRVVLLTNVAPPGLSEEALGATEDEIGMAATASGGLRSISVFEVVSLEDSSDSSSYPWEALVRVFVEFGSASEAGKFARSVRGQPFFAGNKARGAGGVAARPFSLERLREGRLAPEPGDVP